MGIKYFKLRIPNPFKVSAKLLIVGALLLLSCSGEEVDPAYVESEYELDGKLYKIVSGMYREKSSESGGPDQLRIVQEVSPGGERDMIILIPVQGSGRLEGSYIYSKTGDIRTYNIVYVRNIKEDDSFEWITNGEMGSPLEIIRAGSEQGQTIYTIRIEDFVLNYGFYDFLGDKWVSLGNKEFSFSYQGTIDPAD